MNGRQKQFVFILALTAATALLSSFSHWFALPRAAAQAGEIWMPVIHNGGPVFQHPLLALADIDGPLPLFDALNDAQGRRYVIGDTLSVEGEDGEVQQSSGLFYAQRRPMGPNDFNKKDPPLSIPPMPLITPALTELIAKQPPNGRVQFVASLKNETMPLQVQVERSIAEGMVHSDYEQNQMYDQVAARKKAQIAAFQKPVVEAITNFGGRIDYACQNAACLVATMPSGGITSIAAMAQVVQLDVLPQTLPNDTEPNLQAPPVIVTGVTVRQGQQILQFIENGYDGNGISDASEGDNVVVAIVETGEGYANHDGFRESGPTSSFRYATGGGSTGKWQCTNMGCSAVNNFANPTTHATGAAGLAFGDVEQGQIPSIPAALRPTISGYAREAVAHLFSYTSGSVQTIDQIGSLSSAQRIPDIVSNSWGNTESPNCSGNSATAQAANRLFEDGIAVFAAAHNFGGSANDCNVTAPGSAIGALTVGAHLWGYEGDPNTVRTAGIYDNTEGKASSWGGNESEGQNRSIVDITATGTRANKFNTSGGYSQTGVICCTSAATPQITGAVADFIDFYRASIGNFIDNPGSLYANVLLMGDRQGVNGKINSRLDHLWGAGRLRMRMYNGAGMDAPWWYFNGVTCISDGEIYDFPIAGGGHLSQDVDSIKAAAYWYDTRHDGSLGSGAGSVADVDLHIVNVPTGQPVVTDSDSYDNKARVYYEDAGGLQLNLRLIGYNVGGHDDPLCGQDAIRVYFATFVEDADRESPVYNPITGTGIFPEGT